MRERVTFEPGSGAGMTDRNHDYAGGDAIVALVIACAVSVVLGGCYSSTRRGGYLGTRQARQAGCGTMCMMRQDWARKASTLEMGACQYGLTIDGDPEIQRASGGSGIMMWVASCGTRRVNCRGRLTDEQGAFGSTRTSVTDVRCDQEGD